MNNKNTLLKLKKKEREVRKKIIIDAARVVFGEKTYDEVSMTQIAKAAGIAKSSIYTYFKSQEEMYAVITCQDSLVFIQGLEKIIQAASDNILKYAIDHFLDYYIANEAQWRMITHFALHGKKGIGSVDQLNTIGRMMMDLFETLFKKLGFKEDTRLLAHTLFSCLSGILIAFRNYPGRSEKERILHMKRIAVVIEQMITTLMHHQTSQEAG